MDMEWQVLNKELSERLKELGVKQDSLWYWIETPDVKFRLLLGTECQHQEDAYGDMGQSISAFTVAELLAAIPKIIDHEDINKISYLRIFTDECIEWCVAYSGIDIVHYFDNSDDPNLANVLAKMRIHLIEKGIINAKTI